MMDIIDQIWISPSVAESWQALVHAIVAAGLAPEGPIADEEAHAQPDGTLIISVPGCRVALTVQPDQWGYRQ
jgi:hypothetical protein